MEVVVCHLRPSRTYLHVVAVGPALHCDAGVLGQLARNLRYVRQQPASHSTGEVEAEARQYFTHAQPVAATKQQRAVGHAQHDMPGHARPSSKHKQTRAKAKPQVRR